MKRILISGDTDETRTCARSKLWLELFCDLFHSFHAFLRKSCHDYGMLLNGIGNTRHSNIAVTNRFDLEMRKAKLERVQTNNSAKKSGALWSHTLNTPRPIVFK